MKITSLALLFLITMQSTSMANCTITSCKGGGKLYNCLAAIKSEYKSKSMTCQVVKISSGVSAYAMATGLPGVCITKGSRIGVHRPATKTAVSPIGSAGHNAYFGNVKSATVAYFKAKGGMRWGFWRNKYFMIYVPAEKTGVRICK